MSSGSHGPNAGRELAGAWSAAVLALIAVTGLLLVSDPDSGREGLIWFLAPTIFLAAIAAGWLGLRARRDGEERGFWPAVVGLTIIGFFGSMLLLAFVGYLLGFE